MGNPIVLMENPIVLMGNPIVLMGNPIGNNELVLLRAIYPFRISNV